jgi:glutaredoxin 3
MKKVTIYTTRSCPYCEAAKKLLLSKNIYFEEIDITNQEEMWEELFKLTKGRQTVPQIFVGGKLIGGYDDLVKFYNSGGSI